jgi:hypothetical protein
MGVPLIDVQARWAYSEIIDSVASHWYDNGYGIKELRTKRSTGVPYDRLSEEERYNLAFQGAQVRQSLFIYFIGTDPFDIVEINRDVLAKVLVPPIVSRIENCVPFKKYIATTSKDLDDARNVTSKQQFYEAPIDPVTIGRLYEHPILIDGFHRAALLWKFAPAGSNLFAYIPRALSASIATS